MSLSDDIKEYALDIGYSKVGITTAAPFAEFIEDVNSRGNIYDFYVADQRRFMCGAEPQKLMPTAKSIVTLAWDYAQKAFPENLIGKLGRIYQARCYNAPPHRMNGARHQLMADFLKKIGCEVGQGIFVPERQAAARAGISTFGRNNFAYADGIGSFILLSSFVVDAELEYDEPTIEVKCPSGCRACIDACPTKAIYEPNKLNPRRCIAFNAWWTQDGRPGVSSHIPHDIREKMGTRVHGCDVCQEVCPRNHAKLNAKLPEDEYLEHLSQDFTLDKMLNMPGDFYATRVLPLMYNYIKDKKYFQRNAAIALGNTGDEAYVPALARALEDAEPLVREYAAWALGRIGGADAKSVLEAASRKEAVDGVVREMESALARR